MDAKGVWPSYKGSTFHRIIPGFMMHGGDITHHDGSGTWGLAGSAKAPPSHEDGEAGDDAQGGEHGGGWDNGQDTHERGTVALVAGSQFFICFDSLKQLDGYVSEPDHRTLFAHL